VTAGRRPDTGGPFDDDESDARRPRLDKDLLDVSLRWLLFWLVVAVAVLWLSEHLGVFPF